MGYIKALYFTLVAFVGSAGASLFLPGAFDGKQNLINLGVLLVGAIAVAVKKNTPTQPWAKAVVASFTAAALVVSAAWVDHRFSPEEMSQILLALLGAGGVGALDDGSTTDNRTP